MNLGTALMALGPAKGGQFEIRQFERPIPKSDEIEVAIEAASVNPIDVRRSEGYGRRLLSIMRAGTFPMVLGNDFAGTVTAVGNDAGALRVGDRVYGVKPASRFGTHATHAIVKSLHALAVPSGQDLDPLATLPYSFVTMWLAVAGVGLTRANAPRKAVLVHGAGGGLGLLALQLLSAWGVRATAITWPTAISACLESGAAEVVDCTKNPFAELGRSFDATLNFANWEDETALLGCLRKDALGHATTVHPLMGNIDKLGFVRGALMSLVERRRHASALPNGTRRYLWTLFRPSAPALTDLRLGVEHGRFKLPIGTRAALEQAEMALDHVKTGRPGRALILPLK